MTEASPLFDHSGAFAQNSVGSRESERASPSSKWNIDIEGGDDDDDGILMSAPVLVRGYKGERASGQKPFRSRVWRVGHGLPRGRMSTQAATGTG